MDDDSDELAFARGIINGLLLTAAGLTVLYLIFIGLEWLLA